MIGGYGIDPRPVLYINVSTKPISGRYSWTTTAHKAKADRELRSSRESFMQGRHTRLTHRVTIYLN